MTDSNNPILRAFERGRATTQEKRDALLHLIANDDFMYDTPPERHRLMLAAELLEAAEKAILRGDELAGLSTGYKQLDSMTRGLDASEVSVVFGYTSHGKSQLAQNIAFNVAAAGTPVLLLPLEMTPVQNNVRFLSLTDADTFAKLPIYYTTNKQVRYRDLQTIVGQAKEKGVKLVVIDQLQQLTRSVEHQTNEISLITHTISEVAKVHDVHIMLISHVSRTGAMKAPDLPDLKGSSSIEQDADICLAVWRDFKADDEQTKNTLNVFLRKNRNRGMQVTRTKLYVQDGIRLVEPVLDSIFPGAKVISG